MEQIKIARVEIPERGLYDVFVDLVLKPVGLEGHEEEEKENKNFNEIWK